MTSISEYLADVVAECRQHQLVVSARSFRTSCGLQSMLKLADLSAIADVGKINKAGQHPLRPETFPAYAIHMESLRDSDQWCDEKVLVDRWSPTIVRDRQWHG